jgi:hypothetical protein
VQLHDGRLTIYFEPVEDALRVGDTFVYRIALQDDAMPFPIKDMLNIRIVDEQKEAKKEKKEAEPKSAEKGSKDGEGPDAQTHRLPTVILLTRDGHPVGVKKTDQWPEGMTEFDGGIILTTLASSAPSTKSITTTSIISNTEWAPAATSLAMWSPKKYILGMRILMLG